MSGRSLLRWLPAVMMMGVIYLFSSTPAQALPFFGPFDLLVKKGGHALGYGLLGLAYYYALPASLRPGFRWVLALLMAVVFSLSDEFHQSFTEGRTPSLVDVLIDTAGAALALLLGAPYVSNSSSPSTS